MHRGDNILLHALHIHETILQPELAVSLLSVHRCLKEANRVRKYTPLYFTSSNAFLGQEIPFLYWNPKSHHLFQNISPLVTILNHFNPLHTISYLVNSHFNSVLRRKSKSSKWYFAFRTFVQNSHLLSHCHAFDTEPAPRPFQARLLLIDVNCSFLDILNYTHINA
jgi:hypothetical protein